MVIDKVLLDNLSELAKLSSHLRMNYSFHQKSLRFLNSVEPGTEVPIPKHPSKDEVL